MDDGDWAEFARRMATLARDLLAQPSVDATLKRITESAVELMDGCDAAGILLVRRRTVRTFAPTDDLVTRADELQEHLGEGPCLDVIRHDAERVFRVHDLTAHPDRWPRFVPEAAGLGIGSMMGFLLYTEDEELGALNLYSRRPSAFTEAGETTGWLLASHAAVALSSARTHAQLEEAMATRDVIGEAIGILRERHHLDPDQAFTALRRYSQERNIKLRDVARQVCASGRIGS
ncbi:GAF and ANTAR domain-containing protein [Streptomyces sp. NPDC047097]|uniref:GAF and ANTAR domain-containing protein n=1 Tax=Streptomyces sp. NPDC047097 TaxID=3155260 RepID=UPI0033DC22E3